MSDQTKTEWTEEAKARIMSSEAKSGNDPEFAKFAQSETDKTLAKKEDEANKAQGDKAQVGDASADKSQVDNSQTEKGQADNAQADRAQTDNTQAGDDQGEQKK